MARRWVERRHRAERALRHPASVRTALPPARPVAAPSGHADTIDWKPIADGGPTAQQIVDKVVSRARGGSIVLMHLGGSETLEALPGIVSGLQARGFELVTLGTMLGG